MEFDGLGFFSGVIVTALAGSVGYLLGKNERRNTLNLTIVSKYNSLINDTHFQSVLILSHKNNHLNIASLRYFENAINSLNTAHYLGQYSRRIRVFEEKFYQSSKELIDLFEGKASSEEIRDKSIEITKYLLSISALGREYSGYRLFDLTNLWKDREFEGELTKIFTTEKEKGSSV